MAQTFQHKLRRLLKSRRSELGLLPPAEVARFKAGADADVQACFKSQHDEDRYILGLMRPDDVPYVVDVGANDSLSWSNSYLFGKMGCHLLLIEPLPAYAAYCREYNAGNPKVEVVEAAIAKEAGEASFFVSTDKETDLLAMRSSLNRSIVPSTAEEIKVRTRPLSDILEAHDCPRDYFLLSIDAEGADSLVVETARLDRWRPRIVCVEEQIFGPVIPAMMDTRGYDRLTQLGPNGIYRRRGR